MHSAAAAALYTLLQPLPSGRGGAAPARRTPPHSETLPTPSMQGVVELPLRAAAAADPDCLALRPELGPDCDRARARRAACYAPVIAALAQLTGSASAAAAAPAAAAPSGGSGGNGAAAAAPVRGPAGTVGVTAGAGPGGVGNGAKPLSASERAVYLKVLLKVGVDTKCEPVGSCGAKRLCTSPHLSLALKSNLTLVVTRIFCVLCGATLLTLPPHTCSHSPPTLPHTQSALQSRDVSFHHALYAALVDMGQAQALLLPLPDAPHLEPYLAAEAGLMTGGGAGRGNGGGGVVGPLGKRQVQAADLLAKLHVGKGRCVWSQGGGGRERGGRGKAGGGRRGGRGGGKERRGKGQEGEGEREGGEGEGGCPLRFLLVPLDRRGVIGSVSTLLFHT